MPIDNPDLEDLIELLQQTANQLQLPPKVFAILKKGIETNKFKNFAEIVLHQLEEAEEYHKAAKLRDLIPLFQPHQFWDN